MTTIHWQSFIKLGKTQILQLANILNIPTTTSNNYFKLASQVRNRLHQLGFTSMKDVDVLLNTKIKTKGITIGLKATGGAYQGYPKAA